PIGWPRNQVLPISSFLPPYSSTISSRFVLNSQSVLQLKSPLFDSKLTVERLISNPVLRVLPTFSYTFEKPETTGSCRCINKSRVFCWYTSITPLIRPCNHEKSTPRFTWLVVSHPSLAFGNPPAA